MPEFSCFSRVMHYRLFYLIGDTSILTAEELEYAQRKGTHIDFVIYSRFSKMPVLCIEVDGHKYHNEDTEQYQRDIKKDSILKKLGIELLRFSTRGSCQRERIIECLNKYVSKSNMKSVLTEITDSAWQVS